jgi:hypothetical protein
MHDRMSSSNATAPPLAPRPSQSRTDRVLTYIGVALVAAGRCVS